MVIEDLGPQIASNLADVDFLQPLTETLQPLLVKLSILVGGIFGLYLILIIVRVYYERKKVKLLQEIRFDLDHLNMHQGILSSREKKGWFKKTFQKIVHFIKKIFRR